MRFEYMSKGHGFIIVYSVTDPQSFEDCTDIHADLLKAKGNSCYVPLSNCPIVVHLD